ncbi:ribonuclease Z [Tenacibaculum todarodis]|uniref:Ribonuclease Z n=1 Tax=Tenacibaculum todarodis TaxID=1850252 RepID=A0A1L3JI11_9FLAO|nr:GLPGLI family protein [Tenacibaculum todarodis]APG64758.1 ribonuclease Z [Tenacibaculum todarodis]
MKALQFKIIILLVSFTTSSSFYLTKNIPEVKDFQGKATYISKTKMDLGTWGNRMSVAQKKQIGERLKNRLEKTYTLTFNKQESFFEEQDKIDAISGATDSWGKNFTPGDQYKNVSKNSQIQSQEFYGKRFLVKDKLQDIEWNLDSETKVIGNYECYKATASIPTEELTWYSFSWSKINSREKKKEKNNVKENKISMTTVEVWYTQQIPVSHGPQEFWGLPGLILEVSSGNTTLVCTELIINPKDKLEITAPKKGEIVTKTEYQNIISKKMKEFRDMRAGRGRGR